MLQPSKINVTNEEIIERVMRFGIEAKCGIPPEKWWETAKTQLITEKQKQQTPKVIPSFSSLEQWLKEVDGTPMVLLREPVFKFLRLSPYEPEQLLKFKLIGWESPYIPLVEYI